MENVHAPAMTNHLQYICSFGHSGHKFSSAKLGSGGLSYGELLNVLFSVIVPTLASVLALKMVWTYDDVGFSITRFVRLWLCLISVIIVSWIPFPRCISKSKNA